MIQEFICDKCGLESHVHIGEHEDVMTVVHKIEAEHKKWSPECSNGYRELRVVQAPEFQIGQIVEVQNWLGKWKIVEIKHTPVPAGDLYFVEDEFGGELGVRASDMQLIEQSI
jgi:hypothetical protein